MILRSVSLAPRRPRNGRPQPPPSTGRRHLVHCSPSFKHRSLGTQNPPPHHYSGDPVLRLFIPLESKSPQPRTLGPQLLPPSDLAVQASSSSSLKDSGIWALIFILLPARPQNPSSHVTFCEARARPGPGSEAGAAHPRSPAAVHLARGSCALYRPASLCPQEDLAR